MRIIVFFISLGIGLPVIAQTKDSSFVQCSYSYTLKYPKAAAKNKISGEVVIEMDVDENGMLSNPKVIKSIGYGCGEEALRIVNSIITGRNKCTIMQGCRDCKKGKKIQRINFLSPEE